VPSAQKRKVTDHPGLTDAEISALEDNNSLAGFGQSLPTDKAALDTMLRKTWKKQVDTGRTTDSYPVAVFGWAQDLLVRVVKPATRAAFYQLLADQPGIRRAGASPTPHLPLLPSAPTPRTRPPNALRPNTRTAPSGCLESRTATTEARLASSTQSPPVVPLCVLLRQ
jgi:hypothetical protein